MTIMSGLGRYAVGIVASSDSASVAVIEKLPRLVDGREPFDDDAWVDGLRVVGHQRVVGKLTALVAGVAAALRSEELKDDANVCVEITSLGLGVRRLLADREVHALPVIISGAEEKEDENRTHLVPLRVLQARATIARETGRFALLKALPHAASVLRGLENLEGLPVVGPMRDLTLATALAVWMAERHPTHGPWSSRNPPPRASPEWLRLREMEVAREYLEQAAERHRQETEEW